MTRISDGWLTAPMAQRVLAILGDAGHQAFFVGGCVRNALWGVPISDLDIATDAPPDRVMQLAQAAGMRAIPTGIDHGTVTLSLDGAVFEVTTFRRDVATDGRRAVVAFAKTASEDARRRDFTVNALYADASGQVLDPVDGLPDIAARRIRFIGNADTRIAEDYLRILRYFRFHAHYGDAAEGMDPDALAAIAAGQDGLAKVSKERIGSELLKLLAAPDPAPSVAAMDQSGVLARILPGATSRTLAPLVHLENALGIPPDPLRRLAVLGGAAGEDQLRLSRHQLRTLSELRDMTGSAASAEALGYRYGKDNATNGFLLRAVLFEHLVSPQDLTQIATGAGRTFPVAAADLMPDFQGPALGARLKALEERWIATGFALSKRELLDSNS